MPFSPPMRKLNSVSPLSLSSDSTSRETLMAVDPGHDFGLVGAEPLHVVVRAPQVLGADRARTGHRTAGFRGFVATQLLQALQRIRNIVGAVRKAHCGRAHLLDLLDGFVVPAELGDGRHHGQSGKQRNFTSGFGAGGDVQAGKESGAEVEEPLLPPQ